MRVAKTLDIEFEDDYDSYDTINGFLISRLDRIPQEGEQTGGGVPGIRFQNSPGGEQDDSYHPCTEACSSAGYPPGPENGGGKPGRQRKFLARLAEWC